MGVSVNAYLVVGARLSDMVQFIKEESEVTKYNPDTGAPYQQKIEIKKVKIGFRTHDQEADYAEDLIKWPKGLEFVNTGDIGGRRNFDNVVVGVKVAEADDDDDAVVPIDEVALREAKKKAKELLFKAGWAEEPAIYLMQYGSA